MKMNRRICGLLACLLVLLWFSPASARAASAEEPLCSLTLSYTDGETPVTGAEFTLYRVAVMPDTGGVSWLEPYASWPADLEGLRESSVRELALTLESFVKQEQPEAAASGKTGQDGTMAVSDLAHGVYLILGGLHVQGEYQYESQPMIVTLPDLADHQWIYDVTMQVKYEKDHIPDTIRVLKCWKDEGHEDSRPKELTVELYRDGVLYDTVVLTVENNWQHTWEGLEHGHQWKVAEQVPEGYTVAVSREGNTFLLENTPDAPPPTEPPKPDIPKTGQLWWPVPLLTAGGLALVTVGLLRRRSGGRER